MPRAGDERFVTDYSSLAYRTYRFVYAEDIVPQTLGRKIELLLPRFVTTCQIGIAVPCSVAQSPTRA
jgi:hypothetical protein